MLEQVALGVSLAAVGVEAAQRDEKHLPARPLRRALANQMGDRLELLAQRAGREHGIECGGAVGGGQVGDQVHAVQQGLVGGIGQHIGLFGREDGAQRVAARVRFLLGPEAHAGQRQVAVGGQLVAVRAGPLDEQAAAAERNGVEVAAAAEQVDEAPAPARAAARRAARLVLQRLVGMGEQLRRIGRAGQVLGLGQRLLEAAHIEHGGHLALAEQGVDLGHGRVEGEALVDVGAARLHGGRARRQQRLGARRQGQAGAAAQLGVLAIAHAVERHDHIVAVVAAEQVEADHGLVVGGGRARGGGAQQAERAQRAEQAGVGASAQEAAAGGGGCVHGDVLGRVAAYWLTANSALMAVR